MPVLQLQGSLTWVQWSEAERMPPRAESLGSLGPVGDRLRASKLNPRLTLHLRSGSPRGYRSLSVSFFRSRLASTPRGVAVRYPYHIYMVQGRSPTVLRVSLVPFASNRPDRGMADAAKIGAKKALIAEMEARDDYKTARGKDDAGQELSADEEKLLHRYARWASELAALESSALTQKRDVELAGLTEALAAKKPRESPKAVVQPAVSPHREGAGDCARATGRRHGDCAHLAQAALVAVALPGRGASGGLRDGLARQRWPRRCPTACSSATGRGRPRVRATATSKTRSTPS